LRISQNKGFSTESYIW